MDKLSCVIKKYPKWILICGVLAGVVFFLLYGERARVLQDTTEDRIAEEARGAGPVEDDFYTSRLSENERIVLETLEERMSFLRGGVVELPVALNGEEYNRVMTALEAEMGGCFYGFYEIPMTAEGIALKERNRDVSEIKASEISQVILFLSCAEGIHLKGSYGKDGKVLNLEEVDRGLAANLEDEVKEIRDKQELAEDMIGRILEGISPMEGKKETIDQFILWMDENLTFWDKTKVGQATDMKVVIEKGIEPSGTACVLKGQASVAGYNRLLSRLCNEAGIRSHVVMGTWGSKGSEAYMMCAVEIGGEWIYIDAAGCKNQSMGGQRFLSEAEAMRHLRPVSYFTYEEEKP